MIINSFQHGQSFENEQFFIFMGNRFLGKKELLDLFPIKFAELNQVHEDLVIEQHTSSPAIDVLQKADAHFTSDSNLSLIVKSADCMPICIFDPSLRKVLSIHAGWRGIANQITIKSIKKVFPQSEELTLVIGPHIHQASFEVDLDVKNKIIDILKSDERKLCYKTNQDHSKYYINLKMVLLHDLKNHFPNIKMNFFDSEIDTFKDSRFNSFRRDKDKSGRNYSFIFLKSPTS